MRIGIEVAIAIFALGTMYAATAHTEQCPAGSGEYCPAGTHCSGSTCVKDMYCPSGYHPCGDQCCPSSPPPPPPPPTR